MRVMSCSTVTTCNAFVVGESAIRYACALQSHLNDGFDLERLEALMPKALGITSAAAVCTYARQLESVAARRQNGDSSMLQPVVALPYMVIGMVQAEVKKEAVRKELALLG